MNIPIEDSYAFGDGENDIEMLATVGCGIAMGNAAKAVKAHAKKVTDSVSQDGVASGRRCRPLVTSSFSLLVGRLFPFL